MCDSVRYRVRMDLAEFLAEERGRGAQVARALSVPPAWLSQMAAGRRPVPPQLVAEIERLSAGAVRRWNLRPLDWHRIWPELIGDDGAPELPDPTTTTQPAALDAPVSQAGELDAA